ncbi:MAG: DUF1016 domain-containing protein [Oscillospiraceae bacterium]|nr:DUF1016 domain-containing protein [Oscillospiraceae bacterium]
MEIGNEHSKKQLETGLIKNIKHFFAKMEGYFSFMGSQYHIGVDSGARDGT